MKFPTWLPWRCVDTAISTMEGVGSSEGGPVGASVNPSNVCLN